MASGVAVAASRMNEGIDFFTAEAYERGSGAGVLGFTGLVEGSAVFLAEACGVDTGVANQYQFHLDSSGMNLDYYTKYGVSVDPKDYDYVVKHLKNLPNNYTSNKWREALNEQMQYDNKYDSPAQPASNKRKTEYTVKEEKWENNDELDTDDNWSQINEYLLERYGKVTNSSALQ